MAVAIISSCTLALFRAKWRGMDGDFIVDCLIWVVVGSVIGARLYYVIFYGNWSEILYVWHGGLAIYGGILGGTIALFLKLEVRSEELEVREETKSISKFKKNWIKFLELADVFAPCLLLGQAIGRWGNFVNAEAHGGAATNFLRMTIWENGSLISVHPTFLYESVWCLVGLMVILLLDRRRGRPKGSPLRIDANGMIFAMYVAWYGFGRMFIEGLRTDSLMFFGVRVSQVLAGVSFVLAVIWLIKTLKNKEERIKNK